MLEVFPDLFRRGIELTPVWVLLPGELITVTWDIASASWIAVLKPCSTDIVVFLVDLELDIFEKALSLVRDLQPSSSSANTDHANVSFGMQGLLSDAVAVEILVVPLVFMVSVAGWNGGISIGA